MSFKTMLLAFVLGNIVYQSIFPVFLGTLVMKSQSLSVSQIEERITGKTNTSLLQQTIILNPEKMQEKKISIAEIQKTLSPLLTLLFQNGTLFSEDFEIPLQTKVFLNIQQLGFYPLRTDLMLKDIATLEERANDNKPSPQCYTKATGLWSECMVQEQFSRFPIIGLSQWIAETKAKRKAGTDDIQITWHAKNESILLWWQIFTVIGILFWGMQKVISRMGFPKKTPLGEAFLVQGISISAAQIPKKKWMQRFTFPVVVIQYFENIKWFHSLVGILGITLFLGIFSPSNTIPFHIKNETGTKAQKTFEDAKTAIQSIPSEILWESAIFIPFNGGDSGTLSFESNEVKIEEKNNGLQQMKRASVWDFDTTPLEGEDQKKIIAFTDHIFWKSAFPRQLMLFVNFSAMKENLIAPEESAAFLQLISDSFSMGETHITHAQRDGTDISAWFLKNTNGEMINAEHLFIQSYSQTAEKTLSGTAKNGWNSLLLWWHWGETISFPFVYLGIPKMLFWLWAIGVMIWIFVKYAKQMPLFFVQQGKALRRKLFLKLQK